MGITEGASFAAERASMPHAGSSSPAELPTGAGRGAVWACACACACAWTCLCVSVCVSVCVRARARGCVCVIVRACVRVRAVAERKGWSGPAPKYSIRAAADAPWSGCRCAAQLFRPGSPSAPPRRTRITRRKWGGAGKVGTDQEDDVDDDEPEAHEEDFAQVGAGKRATVGSGAELHPGDGDEEGVGRVGERRAVAGAGAADGEVAVGELLQHLADEERDKDTVDELEDDVANGQDDFFEGEGVGQDYWGRECACSAGKDSEQECQSEVSACLREESGKIGEISLR
jgi:hypothetical protein